jgi:hypothetical protein
VIRYFPDLIQGTDAWLAARCGLLTASEMRLAVTIPKPETRVKKDGTPYKQREIEPAETDACRSHVWELAAQRITKYVEPSYIGDDMLRGMEDEITARALYEQAYAPVTTMGFITNDRWGFTLGCSPDGLVGDDGTLECKSRRQKYQLETIATRTMPDEYVLQVQTALLVSERPWCDFISYSGGLPMITIRVYPDPKIQAAIIEAAAAFERQICERIEQYGATLASGIRLIPTERTERQEIF